MRAFDAVDDAAGRDVACLWAALRNRGAILLRSGPREAERFDFTSLTESLAANFRVHHSVFRIRYSEDGTVQSVNTGRDAIELHAERAYLPDRPELLFLHCIRPAAAGGGETIVCDGAALLDDLDPRVRDECERARLVWHTTISKESWSRSWPTAQAAQQWLADARTTASSGFKVEYRFEGDTLVVDYECPLIERSWIGGRLAFASYLLLREPQGPSATLANGDAVPASWIADLHRAADRLTARVVWQAGDTLVLDNTRYLHGRRATPTGERRILVRMGDVRPELREARVNDGIRGER